MPTNNMQPVVLTADNYQRLLPIADKQLELGLISEIGGDEWNTLSDEVKKTLMKHALKEKEYLLFG